MVSLKQDERIAKFYQVPELWIRISGDVIGTTVSIIRVEQAHDLRQIFFPKILLLPVSSKTEW